MSCRNLVDSKYVGRFGHLVRGESLRVNSLHIVLVVSDFYVAIPSLIVGSIVFGWLDLAGFSRLIEGPMAPITVGILGLPSFTGICFIHGVLRTEMAIEMLVIASGTFNLAPLTPIQIFVFCLVVSLYIPSLATSDVVVRVLT
jgi:ferrous iron transport protein B